VQEDSSSKYICISLKLVLERREDDEAYRIAVYVSTGVSASRSGVSISEDNVDKDAGGGWIWSNGRIFGLWRGGGGDLS